MTPVEQSWARQPRLLFHAVGGGDDPVLVDQHPATPVADIPNYRVFQFYGNLQQKSKKTAATNIAHNFYKKT